MRLTFLPATTLIGAALGAVESPMPGYGIEEIQWNLEVSPGKIEHLNGTVQEVISQAKQLNPDFVAAEGDAQQAAQSDSLALAKRSSIQCNKLPKGDIAKLRAGISYLRGLSGGLTEGPGPGNCGRVSCSWKSAIWICNDAPTAHYFDSWNWIANSASAILSTCPSAPGQYGNNGFFVSGQNFEDGDWNVIVRDGDC